MSYGIEKKALQPLLDGKSILITGGTGSFGNMMTETLLKNFKPRRIIIFSRDEFKQYVMKQKFQDSCMRYFIGDVRDYERLLDAFRDVDLVFHAAALKQVETVEYNPMEAIKTNVTGSENVVRAAINMHVERVIAISTDKCVNPVNLYGATKLCLEKLFVNGNLMAGSKGPLFSVLRYGNVLGSRGSVLPVFLKQSKAAEKVLTITSPEMTRFTVTLQNAINFVLLALQYMIGGEVFIPKLPSYNIMDLAKLIGPDCETKIIGIRPGEKMHEKMISEDESYLSLECDTFYVIKPSCEAMFTTHNYEKHYSSRGAKARLRDTAYSSGENELIDPTLLRKMIDEMIEAKLV